MDWIKAGTKTYDSYEKPHHLPLMMRMNGDIILPIKDEEGLNLYKFDSDTDTFIEWAEYSDIRLPWLQYHTYTYDLNNDIMYIICRRAILSINLSTKKHECLKELDSSNEIKSFRVNVSSMVINNKLHIFHVKGGNKYHIIFDIKSRESVSNIMETGDKIPDLRHALHVMIPVLSHYSQYRLMFIDGHRSGLDRKFGIYHVQKRKWDYLGNPKKQTLPNKLGNGYGHIITKDEQYIIIFGGDSYEHGKSDVIYIMNVHDHSYKLSTIKCPIKGKYHALLVDKYKDADIVIHGYMRDTTGGSSDIYLSIDLVNLLATYFMQTYVHLMSIDSISNSNSWYYEPGHWKISLKSLLDSIK